MNIMKHIILLCFLITAESKGGTSRVGSRSGSRTNFRNGVSYTSSKGRVHSRIATYAAIYSISNQRKHYSYKTNKKIKEDIKDKFKCKNKKIISINNLCNNVNDCGDGSDEMTPYVCKSTCDVEEITWYILQGIILFMIGVYLYRNMILYIDLFDIKFGILSYVFYYLYHLSLQ